MSSISLAPTIVRPMGRVGDLLLVAAGVLLVAASAQIVLPLPFSPVPITGQTFAVLLVGSAFGASRGAVTMLAYLAIGMVGVPVFAGLESGWGAMAAPSAGYLVGMLGAAYVVGRLADRGWDRSVRRMVLAMLVGNAVIYAFGVTWLGVSLGIGVDQAIVLGALPFLVGDAVKVAAATAILPTSWKLVHGRRC
jgi:biotin transport system substrate-specific component